MCMLFRSVLVFIAVVIKITSFISGIEIIMTKLFHYFQTSNIRIFRL